MSRKHTIHLDIYEGKSILYNGDGSHSEYVEGKQDKTTIRNYAKIKAALDNGFLNKMLIEAHNGTFQLDSQSRELVDKLVESVTSEMGRGLVGLTFLQLTIKSIVPKQTVRLHKGNDRGGGFSWVKGISMRTLDSAYNVPFLRDNGLLNFNKYGVMTTRSLAENYPYSKLYKAELRGPVKEWLDMVDGLENGKVNPKPTLLYLMAKLVNHSEETAKLGTMACDLAEKAVKYANLKNVTEMLFQLFETTRYSARAFEVVIHSFMQALVELGETDLQLVPLSQMRSANKKHHNVGDIELMDGNVIVESWDAKFGKPYLYDELDELKDKLYEHPGVKIAGFIVDRDAMLRPDVQERMQDVSLSTGTEIKILNFDEWISTKLADVSQSKKNVLAGHWLVAAAETFARKRLDIAPIDEPCDDWLKDLIAILEAFIETKIR